ncbi:unnamed protein product, partial [Rotaria sordida]
EYKDAVNYDSVLKRTAEYGNKYMKDCPILSIVLQLLFEGIDDTCMDETNAFNNLWCAITNNGLKSIENFSDNKKRSVLFQALREYYCPKLFELLNKSKISDKDNLYESALNNVAEYGWLQGLQEVEKRIIVKHFKILLANIPVSGDTSRKQVQPKVEAPTSVNEQSCMFGKDTQISWKFSGIWKLRVTWFFNDQPLSTDNRLEVTETDDGTSILTIRQVELGDQGVYTTRATNAFGVAEAQTTLKIDCIKPVINANLNSALEVTKGETMGLKIVASGTPKPDIVWMKDDNELTPNDRIQVTIPNGNDDKYTMAILNAQPGDQGEYSAKISNVGGSLQSNKCKVTVSKSPVFIVKLTTQKVKQGTTAVFVTKIDGYPTPTITWLLNEKPLTAKEGVHVQFDATNGEVKLSIQNVVLEQHAVILNIPADARWAQKGVTVAGGHGQGSATNQLDWPCGLFVDDDQTMAIADGDNHRIIQWKKGDTNGQVVAGGNGKENRLDQLNGPTDVLIDKETDSLIICDPGNRRVVRWSRRSGTTQGEILTNNIHCRGLAMDDQRYLYISDDEKHEVRRYQIGDKNGTLVAGGNGKGASLDQLNYPTYIFVDQQQTVYVSDSLNHRVMKWNKGAKEGIVVAGGQGQGNALTQLSYPYGLFVDTLGTIYVAVSWNNRVMRWPKAAKQGTVIVGGNGQGEGANQFNRLEALSFDRHGNLYVVDYGNYRVQRFSIE